MLRHLLPLGCSTTSPLRVRKRTKSTAKAIILAGARPGPTSRKRSLNGEIECRHDRSLASLRRKVRSFSALVTVPE